MNLGFMLWSFWGRFPWYDYVPSGMTGASIITQFRDNGNSQSSLAQISWRWYSSTA